MLNKMAQWTDDFDTNCLVDDRQFSSAYMMYRNTALNLNSMRSCGVQNLPEGSLCNCQICAEAAGKEECMMLALHQISE